MCVCVCVCVCCTQYENDEEIIPIAQVKWSPDLKNRYDNIYTHNNILYTMYLQHTHTHAHKVPKDPTLQCYMFFHLYTQSHKYRIIIQEGSTYLWKYSMLQCIYMY